MTADEKKELLKALIKIEKMIAKGKLVDPNTKKQLSKAHMNQIIVKQIEKGVKK